MRKETKGPIWLPRLGWTLVVLAFVAFALGTRTAGTRLEAPKEQIIRMLFVPSVEQGTLVERGDELATFIRRDSGLTLKVDVPTSYAAVIQALGSGQADVAWMPAFAYVIANARYGAEAKLQVVRSAERFGLVVGRSGPGEIACPRGPQPERASPCRPTSCPSWPNVMRSTLDASRPGLGGALGRQ